MIIGNEKNSNMIDEELKQEEHKKENKKTLKTVITSVI